MTRLATLALTAVVAFFGSYRTARAADCSVAKNGRYAVKIDSAPQGAAIYINSKDCPAVGVTPWDGKLNKGDYTVIIEAPGYEPASKPFKVAALRKTQELFVPLIKKADPPKLDIRADADPKGMAGATILLDGEVKGQAPMVLVSTAGRHQLRIQKDGYEPQEQWLTLTDNQTQTMLPTLKEIAKPKYGTVVVDADVPDAEVYIDGNKNPDNTPTVIQNVIEGLHVIEVRKAPGLPWKQTVQVTANQQTKVRGELQAGMAGGVGVVRVISDAPGARALIDGVDMGSVPIDIKDVKAGDHIVQVKAPGMQTGERHVTVQAGQSQIVKFDLNADMSPDQGILKVVSTVPEAMVFVDGAALGKVPQEKKVSAGEHPVVVRLEGYKEFEQKAVVEAGKTITVQADLKAVGRLRILSTPAQAGVVINGLPVGKTPLDLEVEVGETVVRIEMPGFQPFEQTLTIEGGKTQTLSRELAVAGPSEAELMAEQRGLSSYGARALPRGRSTVDFSAGYPYFLDGRVTVGFGHINKQMSFDANVGVRTMLAQTEIGIGSRATLLDVDPLSLGAFTNIYWGSKLLDNSGRNGLTWDLGAMVSLTALAHVTITGRAYLEVWSDRHCPSQATTPTATNDGFDGDALGVCKQYKDGTLSADDKTRVESLTGWKNPSDVFNRENGARFLLSILAEIALDQHINVFGVFESAPLQSERALFTNTFSHSMLDADHELYLRFGASYKF